MNPYRQAGGIVCECCGTTTRERIERLVPRASPSYVVDMLTAVNNSIYHPFHPCIVCGNTSISWDGRAAMCDACKASNG